MSPRSPSDFLNPDGSYPDPVERGYYHGRPPPIPPAHGKNINVEAPIPIVPTNRKDPISEPPNKQLVINANCPPWNCPPFWSIPFDEEACICIPMARKEEFIFRYVVPQDRMLIIKGISYEIHNVDQYNSFSFKIMDNGMTRLSIEDMLIDPTSANPAHRYVFAGHTRQMPTHLFIDHNHSLVVSAEFLGILDFAGNSNYNEGDILAVNPEMCINIRGWLANVRDSRDGGPRPTDLGNLLHVPLTDDQSRGGRPGWR
jgi:hypothetical protein